MGGPSTDRQPAGDGPRESRKQRVDRELLELLNELRVALPGVQFLFAFLLILPFQATADELTDFHRHVYFVALLAAAVATGLLIAPAAQHRVLFRQKDKEGLLKRSNQSAVAGLLALVAAIGAGLLLVVDMLFSRVQAWITAGAVAALMLGWWLGVPYWRRSRTEQADPRDPEDV